jgi:hypothetical protein
LKFWERIFWRFQLHQKWLERKPKHEKKLQQEADQAIYERRNFAVEQERKIKETELNTELQLRKKTKQITEKKMESEVIKAENDRES